jgi:hypothetical protein
MVSCSVSSRSAARTRTDLAQAIAGEFDPMGVVNEAVEYGVGVGGIGDDLVPLVDGQLAGDERRSSTISLFDYLEEFVTRLRVNGLEGKIVDDEELDAEEGATDAGVASIAAGKREIREELGRTLIENGTVIAACFVSEGAS